MGYHIERLKTFAQKSVELELEKAHYENATSNSHTMDRVNSQAIVECQAQLDYIDKQLDEAIELARGELVDQIKLDLQLDQEFHMHLVEEEEEEPKHHHRFSPLTSPCSCGMTYDEWLRDPCS